MSEAIDSDLNHAASRLIKRQRRVLGWAQDRLADECGLDRTYISAIERHRSNLSLTAMSKLLAALGLTIDDLADEVRRGVSDV